MTNVVDHGLLVAAGRVRRTAGRAASWMARRGHGALRPSASIMGSGGADTSTATATVAVHASPATNLVDLRIGTPSLTLTDVLETGSNGA